MNNRLLTALLTTLVTSLFLSCTAFAQTSSPVGLWKTIDDKSGKPKAMIRITENGGEYRGKIERLFREAGEDPNPKCDKCSGELKGQQMIGMTMLTGLKQDGDEYTGGRILDAEIGEEYKSRLKLIDGGKKLNVRGYIGIPMIGRSQVWIREE